MKNRNGEQKYIGFLLGMVILVMLCFGFVCVTAEPTDENNPPVEVTESPEAQATDELPTQEVPTDVPTDVPTEVPTDVPTEVPTDVPTDVPTEAPTDVPTEVPTDVPTDAPTEVPTDVPTKIPTGIPTGIPTQTTLPQPTNSSTQGLTPTPDTGVTPDSTEGVVPTTPIIPVTPMDTTPPFTFGPINPDELLPENSPQITPGKTEETTEEPINMNGYVIRIAATWDEYQDSCLNLEAISAFEQKYNCKVQFLDLSKETLYNRLMMSCATGITYFDAILVEGTEILVNLEPLGLLHEFSQYMTEAELMALPTSYQKFLSKENVLYGIPAKAPDMAGLWHNAGMLLQYQYTSPLPFYQQGTWNWYQMTSLLKEATRDIDHNGYYDTYGVATSSPWFFSVLESVRGSLFRWDGAKFLAGGTNPVTVQGLSFARKIYANHYVASDYERYFYTGKTPYLAGELSMYQELSAYMNKEDLLFFPYPSVTGTDPYMSVATSAPCAAITVTANYPAQTAELLKLLYGDQEWRHRIETYCNESGFSDQIRITYFKMLENFTVDYTAAFDPSGTIQAAVQSFLKNRTPTVSSVQKFIQPLLEEVIAQKQKEIDLTKVPVEIRW